MKTLETERLILRDWQEIDLDDYFIIMSNPNVTIPEGSLPVKSKDQCQNLLNYLMLVKNNYAIELKGSDRVIGTIGLNEDAKGNNDTCNIGFCLAEEFWGNGIMTEALTAVIANAKKVIKKLSASHNNNPKSEHILKKLGFKQVDILRNVKREVDTEPHDESYFVLELD